MAEVRLWMKMRDPLAALGGVWPWQFTWRDDRGELSRFRYDEIARTWPESRCWNLVGKGTSSGWTRFRQTVRLTLDGPPRWAEISYPLSGQDWTLRVEWEAEP